MQTQADKKPTKINQNNWQTTNIGILVMALIFLMPFGLVLLAMLTFGKNINLKSMFKDFWQRITKGAPFDQPSFWGRGTRRAYPKYAAYAEYRANNKADFDERTNQVFRKMHDEDVAFKEFSDYKKRAQDKTIFERFKESQDKS